MNKLTKLMLATAILATSGFATEGATLPTSQYNGGNMQVYGTVTQVLPASVSGKISVKEGGTFENKNELTFTATGELEIQEGTELKLSDYESANTTYSLGVGPVGYYDVGSIVGVGNVTSFVRISDKWGYSDLWDVTYESETGKITVSNRTVMGVDGMQFKPASVKYYDGTKDSVVVLTYTGEWMREDDFKSRVVSAIASSSADAETKAKFASGATPGGSFDNTNGTVDVTAAGAEKTFSGEIAGGVVKMDYNTNAMTDLKITDATVEFSYDENTTYNAPEVEADYIVVKKTEGITEAAAQTACASKLHADSNYTFSGVSTSVVTDNRKTFGEVLADTNLNKSGVKLKTGDLSDVIKGYKSTDGLSMTKEMCIQLEGNDGLLFTTGKAVEGVNVVTFAGSQANYSGVASFAEGIGKVVASVENALPKKLAESMSDITLEVSGNNSIDHNGKDIVIKDLILNSGDFVIAAGTSLTVGVTAQ